MTRVINGERDFKQGATIRTKLVVPVLASDPGSPAEGQVWFNSTDNLFRYYDGTITVTPGSGSLTAEDVRDTIGAALVAGNNIDVTVNDAGDTITIDVESLTSADLTDFAEAVSDQVGTMVTGNTETGITVTYQDADNTVDFAVTDSPLLEGTNKAGVVSEAVAAIVDSAPTTLDTLNELAAALGDDANFATTVNTALAARTQLYTTTFGDAAATSFTITHNLGTRNVQVTVYQTATPWAEEDCEVAHTTTNTVTISGWSTAPTSGFYTAVVVGRA